MRSLIREYLDRLRLPHRLVRTIRLIGEYRGKEALFRQQAPQVLESLRQVALIESTESSTRIEGITAPHQRIRALVQRDAVPRGRSEQEIAGYRDALKSIHVNAVNMPFTPQVVLQLHRDLYRFVPSEGGRWKDVDNTITERRPDGAEMVRFRPIKAWRTPEAMELLHRRFDELRDTEEFEPLILVAAYVLDFLCIHPFRDGNGRMARLITLWLLYREGYEVGRYISLERIVEETKETYYDALYRSSQAWHEGEHDLVHWLEYFLGVMLLEAYRRFEERTGELATGYGAKTAQVLAAFEKLPTVFRYADLERACPNVSRPTIKKVLRKLREQGRVDCVKQGRDARWRKTGSGSR